MKKLATFLVFGAVLAAGLPGLAMAKDVVQIDCDRNNDVSGAQTSAGVTLPASCAGGKVCAQCQADLLSKSFKWTFDYTDFDSIAQSIGIFTRGAEEIEKAGPFRACRVA